MIEVGDYVRTKTGIIDKVQNYSFGCNVWHCEKGMCIDECNCIGTHLEDIVKHSKNLVDLIEVGDIVNKEEILEVIKQNGKIYLMTSYCPQNYIKHEIKDILTHEQYMQNCYTVERKEEC